MIKKILFTLVVLICFPGFIFAKTQSKTRAVSKVDGLEVIVESDQPGKIDLKVENGKVEIGISKGLTPTIFISDKKITPTIFELSSEDEKEIDKKEIDEKEIEEKGYRQERDRILEWIKSFFSSIFNFLFR